MDDVPWLYVAMIFIAFASWVWQRFQEAAEIRRERMAARKRTERERQTTQEPEWDSPYQNQTAPSHEQAPRKDTPTEEATPKSFRDIFAEIERQISEPEVVVEEPPTPPPLPATTLKEKEVAIETDAPSYSPEPGAIVPSRLTSVRSKKLKSTRRSRKTSGALVNVLRNRSSLRTALILKEVLDKPKALKR